MNKFPLPGGDTDTNGIPWRDTTMLALVGFIVLVVLLLPFVNPKAKKAEDDIAPPGNVIVELFWSDKIDADIDLWTQAPGDVPVGYSNKGGKLFNLLRDDLGTFADVSGRNYEIATTRGLASGEYTVNVHLYNSKTSALPIHVKVVVSVKKNLKETTHQILVSGKDLKLSFMGEELTVFRFTLDPEGNLVKGSVTDLPKPLRSTQFLP